MIFDKNYSRFLTSFIQDSDMILVKNLVIILLARFTQDSDMILVKILVRSLVSILLAKFTHHSDKIPVNNFVKYLVIILLARFTQDSWQESCQYGDCTYYPSFWHDSCQECCHNLACTICPRFLTRNIQDSDMIPDKNHVRIWGNPCKQDNNKFLDKDYPRFLTRILLLSCLQELSKILKWFLSS